jgi:hypothetical protein
MTRTEFDEACAQYEEFFSASETSGYRTALHNRAVGSKLPMSTHRMRLGRDVVYDCVLYVGPPPDRVTELLKDPAWKPTKKEHPNHERDAPPLEECRKVGNRLGLYIYREGDHDHLRPKF